MVMNDFSNYFSSLKTVVHQKWYIIHTDCTITHRMQRRTYQGYD
eukprot:UN18547